MNCPGLYVRHYPPPRKLGNRSYFFSGRQNRDIGDGAIIVVDCVEGPERPFRPELSRRLSTGTKPVIFCNKLDRVILELQMTGDEIYEHLHRLVERTNRDVFSSLDLNVEDGAVVDPMKDEVVFGSGKDGWGFTLSTITEVLKPMFGGREPPQSLRRNLWGNYYFDPEAKKVVGKPVSISGKPLPPFLSQFFLQPLVSLVNAIMQNDAKLPLMLQKIGVALTNEEGTVLTPREKVNVVLSRWMPLSDCLNAILVEKLPSPIDEVQMRRELESRAISVGGPRSVLAPLGATDARETVGVQIHGKVRLVSGEVVCLGRIVARTDSKRPVGVLAKLWICDDLILPSRPCDEQVRQAVVVRKLTEDVSPGTADVGAGQISLCAPFSQYAPLVGCNIIVFTSI